jgi:hypothetical protein
VFLAVISITGLFLTAGCGSSGSPGLSNPVGFNTGSFSGTYVISIAGTDVTGNGSYFAITGTIGPDGSGNIKTGTVDINDTALGGVFTGQAVSGGSYSVTPDGRGRGSFATPEGTFGFDFVLTSTSHGLITRFDNNGSGSGTIDLQGSATQSALGAMAFSLSGVDASQQPFGSVGAFTLDSNGNITSGTGTEDFNDDSNSASSGATGANLTGTVSVGSGTFGTAQLTSALGTLTFDVWPIDSTHLKLIETDSSRYASAGDAFTQQSSLPSGQVVYTVSGIDGTGAPIAAGGFYTFAGGSLSAGLEDYNDAGTLATLQNLNGSCTTLTDGRCSLTLTGFSNGTSAPSHVFAAYPSSGGIQLLEVDGLGLLQGAAFAQSATALTTSGNYGLNISGVNSDGEGDVGEVDDIAQFIVNGATGNSTDIKGKLDENSLLNGLVTGSTLAGSNAPDSPAEGRGTISVSANNPATFLGGLTLQYYVVDSSTVLTIEVDSQQLAVGTFQLQNSGASAGVAQSRILSLAHVHAHAGAAKRK